MPSIADKTIDMVLADLPYQITSNQWDTMIPLAPLWEQYRRITKTNAAIVLTATQPFASALVMSNPKEFKYEWIWEKSNGTGFLNAKKQPLRSHEQVLVFYRAQPTYNPQMTAGKPYRRTSENKLSNNYRLGVEGWTTDNDGTRYPRTVLQFNHEHGLHPTQKPVELMRYLIQTYTNEGDTVLDNCMGSGTTGVACAQLGRNFIGIEKDAAYFEVADKRIWETTLQIESSLLALI